MDVIEVVWSIELDFDNHPNSSKWQENKGKHTYTLHTSRVVIANVQEFE